MTVYSILIIGCGLVTWLPRILPFVLITKLQFPAFLLRFLSYVPAYILTALLMQSIFIKKEGIFQMQTMMPYSQRSQQLLLRS